MKNWTLFLVSVVICVTLSLIAFTSCSTAEPSGILSSTTINNSLYDLEQGAPTNINGLFYGDGSNITAGVACPTGTIVGTTDVQTLTNKTITLGGDITLNGKYFQAGSNMARIITDTNTTGLMITNTTSAADGAVLYLRSTSASPADNDYEGFIFQAYDDNSNLTTYGRQMVVYTDVSNGAEQAQFQWYLANNPSENLAMYLRSDGTLFLDVGTDTFDEEDDAKILEQGIGNSDYQLLEEKGIFENREFVTINGTETALYSVNIQKFMSLLAGGIYQNREKIDALQSEIDSLKEQIKLLEVSK